MLSYTTPATIKANNAEAAKIMEAKGYGVDRNAPSRASQLAETHAAALTARKVG